MMDRRAEEHSARSGEAPEDGAVAERLGAPTAYSSSRDQPSAQRMMPAGQQTNHPA
jgi:hypothetical protein